MDPKIIAFHLPQYHSFPENDKWWGTGFTEWHNVKKARPLFENHYQPRIPNKYNYYCMLDVDTIKWQCEISQLYGIDGFCYYHYWFDGKLLMEKPLEILLTNTTIDQKYCLCWANEPWTRSWDGKNGVVLINQNYGGTDEWEEHFKYLIPYFMDSRYIRVDGKPVLIIYRANSIPRFSQMVLYWKKRSHEIGLEGLYVIEENNYYQKTSVSEFTDAALDFEPMYTLRFGRGFKEKLAQRIRSEFLDYKYHTKVRFYSYDSIWNSIINRKTKESGKDYIQSGFVDWDNTPRRGNDGIVFTGGNPKKFENYITKLLENTKKRNQKLLFINAWNEWAEGAYLEPDEERKYDYLNALKQAKKNF